MGEKKNFPKNVGKAIGGVLLSLLLGIIGEASVVLRF
jgi:hypothetical protein